MFSLEDVPIASFKNLPSQIRSEGKKAYNLYGHLDKLFRQLEHGELEDFDQFSNDLHTFLNHHLQDLEVLAKKEESEQLGFLKNKLLGILNTTVFQEEEHEHIQELHDELKDILEEELEQFQQQTKDYSRELKERPPRGTLTLRTFHSTAGILHEVEATGTEIHERKEEEQTKLRKLQAAVKQLRSEPDDETRQRALQLFEDILTDVNEEFATLFEAEQEIDVIEVDILKRLDNAIDQVDEDKAERLRNIKEQCLKTVKEQMQRTRKLYKRKQGIKQESEGIVTSTSNLSNSSSEMRSESTIYTIQLRGNKYELPVEESEHRYPSNITESTGGVIGYERMRVSWDKYEKILSQDVELGYREKLEQFEAVNEKKEEIKKKIDKKREELFDHKHQNQNNYFKIRKLEKELDELKERRKQLRERSKNHHKQLKEAVWSAIRALSDGEFPENTCNHVFQQRKRYESVKVGLTTQRIFDPETAKKISERNSSKKDTVFRSNNPLYFFNTETLERVHPQRYWKQNKHNQYFAVSSKGLSLSRRGRLHWTVRGTFRSTVYGFSEGNRAFIRYLSKAKSILQKQDAIEIKEGKNKNGESVQYGDGWRQVTSADYFLRAEHPGNFVLDSGSDKDHPWIPVVIGHPEIPDMRWCHASWAYIPTEKYLNVLHFVSE